MEKIKLFAVFWLIICVLCMFACSPTTPNKGGEAENDTSDQTDGENSAENEDSGEENTNPDGGNTNPDEDNTNPDEGNTNPDGDNTNPDEDNTNPDSANEVVIDAQSSRIYEGNSAFDIKSLFTLTVDGASVEITDDMINAGGYIGADSPVGTYSIVLTYESADGVTHQKTAQLTVVAEVWIGPF